MSLRPLGPSKRSSPPGSHAPCFWWHLGRGRRESRWRSRPRALFGGSECRAFRARGFPAVKKGPQELEKQVLRGVCSGAGRLAAPAFQQGFGLWQEGSVVRYIDHSSFFCGQSKTSLHIRLIPFFGILAGIMAARQPPIVSTQGEL